MLNTDSKYEILEACPDLRKCEEYKKVYITPDLTGKQQEKYKNLRDKLKELKAAGDNDLRIKRGKIVKKLKRTRGGCISTSTVDEQRK